MSQRDLSNLQGNDRVAFGIGLAHPCRMSSRFKFSQIVAALAMAGFATATHADPIYFGPTTYQQFADSPLSGASFSYFFLETFEDGLFNTPGVVASAGVVNPPNMFVDSVDGDDGVLDGSGSTNGYSFYPIETGVTFSFDAAVLGTLPTFAGLVWTDIGYNSPTPYFGPVTFEAFGPLGVSLGLLGPIDRGDGSDVGEAAEDTFFGIYNSAGISAIRMTTDTSDWELDHLQYGAVEPMTVAPEPGTLTLVGLGALGLLRGSRRRPKGTGPTV